MEIAPGFIAGTLGLLVLHLTFVELGLGGAKGSVGAVLSRRASALVLLGVVPAVAALVGGIGPVGLGLGVGDPWALAVAAGLGIVAVPLVSLGARSKSTQVHHPEIRLAERSWGLVAVDALTWVVYLLAYELLFRGVFLLPLAEEVGPVAATAIVLVPYVAVHLDKGPGEAIGSVFSGVLFAALTLWSGAIWAALLLHVFIAFAGEGAALAFNRDLRVR